LVFLIGMGFISHAQTKEKINKQYIDSVFKTLDTIPGNFDKIEKLVRLAGEKRYTKPTRALIDKAIDISKIGNQPRLYAHTYYSIGNYYFFNSKMDSCLSSLDNAFNYSKDLNEPLLQASILSTKGGAYRKLGAVILAISTHIEAKTILDGIDTLQLAKEDIRKYKGQNLVLNNSLANLHSQIEDYDQAVPFYEAGYKAALELGDNGNAAIVYSNMGDLLIKKGEIAEGLKVLEEAKQMKIDNGLPARFIATSDLLIGMANFEIGDYDKALSSYEKAIDTYTTIGSERGLMESYTMLGLLYNAQNKTSEALAYCERGKAIALNINDSDFIIKSCNCLYDAHNRLGNYKESLENHELYTKIKDSVFNEKNIRKITQVGMQYEFDKKEAEQQLVIDQKNRQKNLILAGLIASGVFATMLFVFFRKRLKYQRTISEKNKAIQQQKITELQQNNKLTALNSMIEGQEVERLRIAKDLHDSLGGLLSTVKAHFTTVQNENEELKQQIAAKKTDALIDEACIEVRRISHNMMPHALSISGLKGAIEDLGERLTQEGYNTTVEVKGLTSKIDNTKEVMIYRLIQEINSNIRKHADAGSILIQVLGHNGEISILVEDDGKGFDYDKAMANGGLGLKSINSRVEFLDGTIDWDTKINEGTSLTINIPVN